MRHLPFWLVTAVVYVFLLAPVVVVAILSLAGTGNIDFSIPPRKISLDLYAAIPLKYYHIFFFTFMVAAATAVIAVVIGSVAALGIVRGRLPGKEFLQAFFRLPLQIPFVVTGVVFLQFYNVLFRVSGIDLLGTFAGLIAAFVFVSVPYSVGAVSAVLLRLSPELEEAAQSLGATNWSTFRRVTFPAMRPGIFAGLSYAFIISFGDVPIALFLVHGDQVTLPVEIFQDMQFNFDSSLFALSTLIVIFSAGLIVAMQRFAGIDLVLPSSKH